MNDIVLEFLIEKNENLARLDLDLDLVTLEKDPRDTATLARVFRTLHSVKGTSGFLGLPKLQAVAHAAETLLSRLRAGELVLGPAIASALLAVVDAVRTILAALEADETEGSAEYPELIARLARLTRGEAGDAPAPAALPPTAPPPPPSPCDSRARTGRRGSVDPRRRGVLRRYDLGRRVSRAHPRRARARPACWPGRR